MSVRRLILIVGLGMLSLAGCLSPVQQDVDSLVCGRSGIAMDVPPPGLLPPPEEKKPRPPVEAKKPPSFLQRMEVPEDLPGSEAPKIEWAAPKVFGKLSPKEKDALVAKHFKAQMEVGPDPPAVPGPEGRPLTLADLQRLAREHSPLLRQAASDIKAAEGAVIQAGVYPNPTLSYTSSAVSFTNGSIWGASISQTISTMGKLTLAQAAAKMDLVNAQLAYRRAETDLMASVRSAYFGVLVAQEGMRANRALMELTDQVYKVMLLQLKGGEVGAYEPAQVGVYAGQARIAYIQSRNSYLQSWKNLATAIGLPMMPVTQLAGNINRDLPRFDFDKALAFVLANHTDVLTARYGLEKARYNLRLAEVAAVPDFTLGVTVLYDATLPGPARLVPGVSASAPIPVFDRNQGGIRQAQAALIHAIEEPHRVQNALTASFADAYRRLEENRQILELYRQQLLPQQIQAFRGVVLRHYGAGPQEFILPGGSTAYLGDLIATEQNVVSLIATYLTTLQAYWQAVSDTASLLQTDDFYDLANQVTSLPTPDWAELLKLPCCHPCSSLPLGPRADGATATAPRPELGAPVEVLPTPRVMVPKEES
jgi:cobalt-zinc-cadmium efflux system outer membrane protein